MKKIEKAYDTVIKYYDNWHLEPDDFGLQVVEKAVEELLKTIRDEKAIYKLKKGDLSEFYKKNNK